MKHAFMEEKDKWIVPNEGLLQAVAEEVAQGGQVLVTVRGNSMRPLWIDRRDKVVLKAFQEKDCQVGTVVLARLGEGTYVLHRIVRIDDEWVNVMGDGNCYSTEWVKKQQIVAKVTAFVRNGKTRECSGWKWKVYSWIWMRIHPLRRWLLVIWNRLN